MMDPTQALRAMLEPAGSGTSQFPANSRYHGAATATLTASDGRTIVYLRRRFVPPPGEFSTVREHLVVQGDRLDRLAAQYLGDPELFWRLCDANGAIRPNELTETPGSRLAIALPHGVEGPSHA